MVETLSRISHCAKLKWKENQTAILYRTSVSTFQRGRGRTVTSINPELLSQYRLLFYPAFT